MIAIMSRGFMDIFADGRVARLGRDEVLFHTGDRVELMYLVTSGQADMIRHSVTGTRIVLHRAGAGQVLAEASAYSPAYHCDGVAVGQASLRALPVREFLNRLDRDPELARDWAAGLARALQGARLSAEIRGLRTVAERLDAWLAGERQMPPRGEWPGLAQTLGVTREALYRELSQRRGADGSAVQH